MVPVSPPDFAPADGGAPVVVIGVGNEFRRDDGAGPAVLARLRDLAPPGVRGMLDWDWNHRPFGSFIKIFPR